MTSPSRPLPAPGRNPQAEQMAHESMVRTLAAQAEAIWPQEEPILRRHGLPERGRVLDVGCGTGEIVRRLAALLPGAAITGVDLVEPHLRLGRERSGPGNDRVTFHRADAFHLPFADAVFDLTLCRHVLQAVPEPEAILAEMVRVTRPGGRLHLVAEDYGMIHFAAGDVDPDRFWMDGPIPVAAATGTDLRTGRRAWTLLRALGLEGIGVDYVTVDTLRVPRETFAAIWIAWRDGYTDFIADGSRFTRAEVEAHWEHMLAALRDPDAYAVWQVPVVGGRVPPRPATGTDPRGGTP